MIQGYLLLYNNFACPSLPRSHATPLKLGKSTGGRTISLSLSLQESSLDCAGVVDVECPLVFAMSFGVTARFSLAVVSVLIFFFFCEVI